MYSTVPTGTVLLNTYDILQSSFNKSTVQVRVTTKRESQINPGTILAISNGFILFSPKRFQNSMTNLVNTITFQTFFLI